MRPPRTIVAMDAQTAPIDGRGARSQRTRYAIVDAWLALAGEGTVSPTARQVAERAGVGLRTVFQHFRDLDALALAASERQTEKLLPLLFDIDPTRPLDERVREIAEHRSRVLEQIRPVRRAALLLEPGSERIAGLLVEADELLATLVQRAFAPELAALPDERRSAACAAVDAACCVATWDHLRRRGLSPEEASDVVAHLLRGAVRPGAV